MSREFELAVESSPPSLEMGGKRLQHRNHQRRLRCATSKIHVANENKAEFSSESTLLVGCGGEGKNIS